MAGFRTPFSRLFVGAILGAMVAIGGTFAPAVSEGLLPDDIRATQIDVTPVGHNLGKLRFGDYLASVTLPENDATAAVHATFAADTTNVCADVDVCASTTLTFDRDVTFRAFPSFVFSVPQPRASHRPCRLVFTDFDGLNVPLVELQHDPFGSSTSRSVWFRGGFFTPFHAKAGKRYTIVVTQSVPTAVRLSAPAGRMLTDLPMASGVLGNLMAAAAPQSALAGAPDGTTPYVLHVNGPGTMWSAFRLSWLLPLTHPFVAPSYVVRIDRRDAASGSLRLVRTYTASRSGDVLSVSGDLPNLSGTPETAEYVVSLRPTSLNTPVSSDPPLMAVVGDSRSVLTVLPQSRIGCNASPGPQRCDYTAEEMLSYAGVVSQYTGVKVVNLSMMDGGQTTVETKGATAPVPSWLASQVPRIPANASYVVIESGWLDLFLNNGDPQTASRLSVLAAAIHAHAPAAKLIFLGVFGASGQGANAWNLAARKLAGAYGGYVAPPALQSNALPDHTHANPEANRVIGTAVANVLEALNK